MREPSRIKQLSRTDLETISEKFFMPPCHGDRDQIRQLPPKDLLASVIDFASNGDADYIEQVHESLKQNKSSAAAKAQDDENEFGGALDELVLLDLPAEERRDFDEVAKAIDKKVKADWNLMIVAKAKGKAKAKAKAKSKAKAKAKATSMAKLLLYSFSVVCRGHFMKYIDHYILAQGGIHNITAFCCCFQHFFGSHLPACLVSNALVAFDTCRLLCSPQNRTVFQASFQVHFLVFHCIRFELPAVLPGCAWWASSVALS